MKLRSIALAGAALIALSVPAAASDYMGWYIGLGGGYDSPDLVHFTSPALIGVQKAAFDPGAIGVVSLGYKWDHNIRTEVELGYTQHDADRALGTKLGGQDELLSGMFNVVYDIPLWHGVKWSVGGGLGFGSLDINARALGVRVVHGSDSSFMWQGITGLSWSISPAVDMYTDWRYRSAETDGNYGSDVLGFAPIHVKSVHENAALIGIRWYLERPAPPPPPPPPPPAVKTFIVFFDFDKSNLTEKAQEVVSEAVKAAKTQGMVKVMVTGHTDTVGSDTYNQALSERRAQSVKDEMVREGLDGGSIAIQGKSFHDPLVPTGPGVREPQNRRAVIDLGG